MMTMPKFLIDSIVVVLAGSFVAATPHVVLAAPPSSATSTLPAPVLEIMRNSTDASKLADPVDASLEQPVSAAAVLDRARKAGDASKRTDLVDLSSAQPVSSNSVLGVDDLYCLAPNYWYCVGDNACFFLFDYIYAPGDYAYCDGYWPDYYCVVGSRYYTCPAW